MHYIVFSGLSKQSRLDVMVENQLNICPGFYAYIHCHFCLCVTGQYLNLDKDHNGMLSKEELSRYGTATLTSVFLERVFQECLTYDGEMVHLLDSYICIYLIFGPFIHTKVQRP